MKIYEKILNQLLSKSKDDNQLAYDLIIDHKIWEDFKYRNEQYIYYNINKISTASIDYIHFLLSYYCPFLGDIDIFLIYTENNTDENNILYNIDLLKKHIPNNTLIPIGCLSSGDYIYLNEKGEVIQFTGIGSEHPPKDFFTEVPDDEYEMGFNIAYLTYPDKEGLYRMYAVIARSFDEFMNDFVCGPRYPELTDKEDNYYYEIMKIRKELGID